MNPNTLLITVPSASSPRRTASTTLTFEVSLNGGYDWATLGPDNTTTSPLRYTVLETPAITKMSHWWSNLNGGLLLTLEIVHMRFNPNCTRPAFQPECEHFSNTLSHARFGERDVPLTQLNETHAQTYVPAQVEDMHIPVVLRTLGGLHFGEDGMRAESMLLYGDLVYLNKLDPPEGHIGGGQSVALVGNWSLLIGTQDVEVRFGNISVTSIESIAETRLTVKLPELVLDPGEDRRSVNVTVWAPEVGLMFQNRSINYIYKNYSTLESIWPR